MQVHCEDYEESSTILKYISIPRNLGYNSHTKNLKYTSNSFWGNFHNHQIVAGAFYYQSIFSPETEAGGISICKEHYIFLRAFKDHYYDIHTNAYEFCNCFSFLREYIPEMRLDSSDLLNKKSLSYTGYSILLQFSYIYSHFTCTSCKATTNLDVSSMNPNCQLTI